MNIVGSNGKTLTKQDAIISDATGTFKLVLWEGNVGKLTLNNSYLFSNLRIKKFSDVRFLFLLLIQHGQFKMILVSLSLHT